MEVKINIMMSWSTLRAVALVVGLSLTSTRAQEEPPLPSHMVEGGRRIQGESVSFCVGGAMLTADFDRALANEIASYLLLDAEIHSIDAYRHAIPLDYRPNFNENELFVVMSETCDAFMGFTLAAGYPAWLTVSRPYLVTDFVTIVTIDDESTRLGDVPSGANVGARYLSSADIQLAVHLEAQSVAERWRRRPYPDNVLLLERLLDGSLDAAIVWGPAVHAFTDGDLDAHGLRAVPTAPLETPEVLFSVGMRSRDSYLRTLIDLAIEALLEDGIVASLQEEHGVPGRPASTTD